MFTNKQLKDMIIPLIAEQFLVMLVGLADTFVVSYAGEAAVSGVSLVNSFNTIFIFLFTALASGGAVIVSQYIGKKNTEKASEAVSQLLMISVLFSAAVTLLILVFNEAIIRAIFGRVEQDVENACITYLRISAYSYPALAVYNGGAALYRSVGKTGTTMNISIIANVINVVGNLIGVFVLHAGVAGVAYPSLISRVFSAAVITLLCFRDHEGVRYRWRHILAWKGKLLKTIMGIAVPNGVESGIFQLVKVGLSSIVALFGTSQIAANGIAQSIWSVASLVSVAMDAVFITVIGQCMGARDVEQAEAYFKKLMKLTVVISLAWNGLIAALTPLVAEAYAVSDVTRQYVLYLVLIHNLGNSILFPFADCLGKGLRAAGDVKYTVGISLFTTIGVRLILSVLFGIVFHMEVIGIALAMFMDWLVRAVLFWNRFKKGKWKTFQVI